ncbi:MAG: DUF3137 domain-containing protein [Clostridia bacterium]|nr:DUF3137 domain-containing protein [Clostridia bacterium]
MKQKNFKEIYDEIYTCVGQEMESKRKSMFWKLMFTVILVMIAAGIFVRLFISPDNSIYLVGIIMAILIIICSTWGIIFSGIQRSYKKEYKEKIINEIVKRSNPSFVYSYKEGISPKEYAVSGFDYGWDIYSTEDLICGVLEDGSDLKMAQVRTEVEHTSTDSDGSTSTSYETTFYGLYGVITLKTETNADFMIRDNSKFAKFNKSRIEMESAEFEKYYDVYAGAYNKSNGQKTLEILTPEAIEEFVKIRNLFKKPLNVRVNGNKIYFRIWVGDIFEPPTFKSSVNFEMLYRYFLIIDVPRMLYETLIDNILVMYGSQYAKDNRNLAKMSEEQKEEFLKKKEETEKSTYFSHN